MPDRRILESGKRGSRMPLTKSLKDLAPRRVASDAAFAENLLREAIDIRLAGDVDNGKSIPSDCIKATVGFEKLGAATDMPPQEPDPHVRPEPQPDGAQRVRRHRLSAEAGGNRVARDGGSGVRRDGEAGKRGSTGAGYAPMENGSNRATNGVTTAI